ncbi:MAG: hypothetical protein CMG55_04040 [Candidatus Marinimicrobia bacterium]|nr:hypothetical protein [Candidatus Neomarinimicrobiota bacterium]|tara:strand:+ start:3686 stop:3877 length:192 start_codon:yes stop_codon:yes gene_type:complete
MKTKKKNTNTKSEKVSKLTKEDGQSEKYEERRIKVKKGFRKIFRTNSKYQIIDKKKILFWMEK